jgi:hypothetical protein
MDTRKARYGNYGPCDGRGQCNSCQRLHKTEQWKWLSDEFFIRKDEDGQPWIMNRPDDGWGEYGIRVSWEFLSRIKATFVRSKDQHGPTIIMRRIT